MLLVFDCLLRVKDLVRLTKGDIARPQDRCLGGETISVFALLLRHTKTGDNRWVELRISDIVQILEWYFPFHGS